MLTILQSDGQSREPDSRSRRGLRAQRWRCSGVGSTRFRESRAPAYYPDTPLVRTDWARYHDLVTAMDLQAGALLKQLDEDGLTGNTVVFFYGDHGRGLPRAKRWVYDSGTKVPLIVRWPGGIDPGVVREDLVCLMDCGPTALSIAGIPVPKWMQGRAFLGPRAGAPREYVFAHRDRMDEARDRIRSVRDRRFRYIRNYHPDRPYAQYIDYMEQMPTMREMRRLNKEESTLRGQGEVPRLLTDAQRLFFLDSKPVEELYDTVSDPHEVLNLAGSPQHASTLKRLRAALDRWVAETKDLGALPEEALISSFRPGGEWPKTSAPVVMVEGGESRVAATIRITCATSGASIAYTTESGPGARWRLYVGEFEVVGPATMRARACRLGFRDSVDAKLIIGAR